MGHGKNNLGSRWRREKVTPILATKLYLPPLRPNVVSRPRLLERLNEGLLCKLTLISAPAGFGKTTLLATWLASLSSELRVLSSQLSQTDQTQNDALVRGRPLGQGSKLV